jgi:hypothetical protein
MTLDTTPAASVFDVLTVGTVPAYSPAVDTPAEAPVPPSGAAGGPATAGTSARVKQAVQELLRLGVLYAEAKPNLYQAALADRELLAAILEPLDLALRVDEVRGMVILVVAPSVRHGDDGATAGSGSGSSEAAGDDWHHPLVRRQRLTLAQSLLLAVLRRRYVEHEKAASGAAAARVAVEELTPELQTYLGDEGSDAANESRVRRLLEQLKEHGIVSAVDDDDQVTIRPLICHVADPTTLQLLLHHYRQLAGGHPEEGAS